MMVFTVASPQAAVTTAAQTSIGATAALILGDGSDPTQTVYQAALGAGMAADDGKGGSYVDDACTTEVRAISSGAGGTCVVTAFRTGSPDWNLAGDLG